MIEAKILEVTDSFTRQIGVQWGGAHQGGILNSDYRYGLLGGTTTLSTPLTKLTTGVSLTQDSLAVDFPSAGVLTPSIGIIMGGANAVLNARISALETTSQGKVISSPRVLISDDEKAVIEQGEQIPVVTPATANTPATVTYKDAVLRLEVTPLIIPEDYVLLTIVARNDRANRALRDAATGNLPINTSKVDSKVAVKDGDTIVIGGIRKSDDEKAVTGVPWLSKIPFLGWLFKAEDITQSKTELLIIVTPRIIRKADTPETIAKKEG
jgi:type IV pilus assembly protein PilQ